MRYGYLGIAILALTIAGCGVTGQTPQRQTYTLALEEADRALDATGPVLEVLPPEARPGFATTGMAYREKPYELAYFAYSEWAAPPPDMLQPLLIDALESSGAFRAVLEGPQRLPADRRLTTELLTLVHDFTRQPSRVEIALRARLIDLDDEQIIATRTFRTVEPAPSDDPYGGVVAANRALARLLPAIAAFSRRGLTGDETRRAQPLGHEAP